MATVYRWIMYAQQNGYGGMSFDLLRVCSLEMAERELARYADNVFNDDVSATLYPYSEEDWDEAQTFRYSGCPFDYPSYTVERNSRGNFKAKVA